MTKHRFTSRLATALLGLGLLAACDRTTEPIILDDFFIVSGDAQTGPAGAELPEPLVVQVNDIDGNAVRGVRIGWTVDIGNGSVSSRQTTTNGEGQASVRFTLGTVEGINGVTAFIEEPGIDGFAVVFGATSTP